MENPLSAPCRLDAFTRKIHTNRTASVLNFGSSVRVPLLGGTI